MRRNSIRMNEEETGSIGIGAMIVFIALILVAAVASAVIIQTGEKLQQNAQQTGDDTQEEIGGKISIITLWIADQTDCDGDQDDVNTDQDDDNDKCITMVYELAAGSEPIDESNVIWTIICANNAGTSMTTVYGTFDGMTNTDLDGNNDNAVSQAEHDAGLGTTWVNSDTVHVDGSFKTTTVAANDIRDDDTLLPGEVYMINLKTETEDSSAGSTGSSDDTISAAECAPVIGEEHTLVISVEGGGTTYETLSYSSTTEGDTIV